MNFTLIIFNLNFIKQAVILHFVNVILLVSKYYLKIILLFLKTVCCSINSKITFKKLKNHINCKINTWITIGIRQSIKNITYYSKMCQTTENNNWIFFLSIKEYLGMSLGQLRHLIFQKIGKNWWLCKNFLEDIKTTKKQS